MRTDCIRRAVAAATLTCFTLASSAPAWAQEPPASGQPPLYQPPPVHAPPQPVQPGYPTQPAYPPPTYATPMPRRVVVGYDLRPRYGLIAGGAVMLGTLWLISSIAGLATVAANDICNIERSAAGCPTAAWPLFVPLAGPFIQMAYLSGPGANTARVLLAFDGAIQLGGLAMIITGALVRKRVPIYAGRMQIAPYTLAGGGGLMGQIRF
ncbi:MAG: hypothetical protein RMK29_13920 [Myxococcales bacterium]|nr:hypothetical protein [Myxococcota bacterium]MDW8282807.1 hypothetical protein [Myxococcales bacterium]